MENYITWPVVTLLIFGPLVWTVCWVLFRWERNSDKFDKLSTDMFHCHREAGKE